MNIAFKKQLSNPNKPDAMPNDWAWGEVINLGESITPPDNSGEWNVITSQAFEAYKILHRQDYLDYINAKLLKEQSLNELLAKNENKILFGKKLMLRFKEQNILNNIDVFQGINLHASTRKLRVVIPANVSILGKSYEVEFDKYIDILNMALSGDLEIGCIALMFAIPDNENDPFSWFTQDNINWLIVELKSYLGWS